MSSIELGNMSIFIIFVINVTIRFPECTVTQSILKDQMEQIHLIQGVKC